MIYSYTYQFWIEETEFPLKSIKYDINNLQEHKLSERIKLEGVGMPDIPFNWFTMPNS